ncbi:MAG: hypothetical protein ACRBHB_16990 [Arenicella sp.]
MRDSLFITDVAEFRSGCEFTSEELKAAFEQLTDILHITLEEANRRIREGLSTYWLKHIYELYVVRKGYENASKDHYINTYIKSGFSTATYKGYESQSRVNEAINKDNLRRIISAFCRFSNEFQQRRHSPLDCLLLIIDGRVRSQAPQLNYNELTKSTPKFTPTSVVFLIFTVAFIVLVYKVAKLESLQFSPQTVSVDKRNMLQPQRQLIDELRDLGAVEYANHATDQVMPEKLKIRYPTKNPVHIYKGSKATIETQFGGHASYKDESIRINWVLVKCRTDCVAEFAQRGGPEQLFGSTQTNAVAAPPNNNWHVPDMPLFSGRNLFIATALYSTGIKRVESLILEPQQ